MDISNLATQTKNRPQFGTPHNFEVWRVWVVVVVVVVVGVEQA
jgi:hypothetical protein